MLDVLNVKVHAVLEIYAAKKRMDREIDHLLKKLYYDLKSPQAYTSKINVYKAAKNKRSDIRKKDVDLWFRKQLAPTLHKPVRYKFKRNKIIVLSIGDQYQSDLCDVTNIAKDNEGFTFLLTCIDCFSRYAWVKPVINKSGKEIAKVLENIFTEKVCKRLQTDKGKEFLNINVKNLLKKYKVELWISNNDDVKASIVERFNRTLKTRMYKYFTANNTRRYVDVLQDLVDGYNNTTHSAIKMSPSKVREKDQVQLRQLLYKNELPKKYKYALNSHVRISKARRTFKKGYLPNWSEEIFTIVSREKTIRPVYTLKDYNNNIIEGKFYEEELQHVEPPSEFRIEKIIKKKRQGNRTLYLVKWVGYSDSFNSWVFGEDLKTL